MEKISDDNVLASVFSKKKKKTVPSKDQNDNPKEFEVANKIPKRRAHRPHISLVKIETDEGM